MGCARAGLSAMKESKPKQFRQRLQIDLASQLEHEFGCNTRKNAHFSR